MMKKMLYRILTISCYLSLYWLLLFLWSFVHLARIGGAAQIVDVAVRIAALPFLVGWMLVFSFKGRSEIWALGLAPFVSSAAQLLVEGMSPNEIEHGVLGFFVVGGVAAFASIAGGIVERRVQHAMSPPQCS
jgi:hypothetical protein